MYSFKKMLAHIYQIDFYVWEGSLENPLETTIADNRLQWGSSQTECLMQTAVSISFSQHNYRDSG